MFELIIYASSTYRFAELELGCRNLFGIVLGARNRLKELLSHPSVRPILPDPLISDAHAIRVKDDDQSIQELDKLGKEVLKNILKLLLLVKKQ